MPQKLQDNWNSLPNLHKLQESAIDVVTDQLIRASSTYLAGIEFAFPDESWVVISENITERYPDMKANEPQYVIKMAANGDFGPLYGKKLSIPDILMWFSKYYTTQRLEYFADMREQKNKTQQAEHNNTVAYDGKTPEYYAQIRQKWLDKWKAQEEEERRAKAAKMADANAEWRRLRAEREKRLQEIEKKLSE